MDKIKSIEELNKVLEKMSQPEYTTEYAAIDSEVKHHFISKVHEQICKNLVEKAWKSLNDKPKRPRPSRAKKVLADASN